jgi:hypothetical protein
LNHASKDENFLKRIITGNETWVYGYNVEKKMQSSQRVGKNLLRPEVAMVLGAGHQCRRGVL